MKYLLVIAVLVGCAGKEQATEPWKKIAFERKAIQREPGSLWSESSSWNSVFTDLSARRIGDTIKLRFTDSLRGWLTKRLKKDVEKERLESAMDELDMAVRILEVFDNGLYSIAGDRKVKFAGEIITLKVQATVRERDLEKDDSVAWDHLYNTSVDIEAKKS